MQDEVLAPQLQFTFNAVESGDILAVGQQSFVNADFDGENIAIVIFFHMGDLADPPVEPAFFQFVCSPFDVRSDIIGHTPGNDAVRNKFVELLQDHGGGRAVAMMSGSFLSIS